MNEHAPDSIEPYVGWKALRLRGDELRSPQQDSCWLPGQPLEAVCSAFPWQLEWVLRPLEEGAETTIVPAFSVSGLPPLPADDPPTGMTWTVRVIRKHHTPASKQCFCGIYVADHPLRAVPYLSHSAVLAEVALWGNVVIADHGARGQYAYPQRLLVPPQLVESIGPVAEQYGIPWQPGHNEFTRHWSGQPSGPSRKQLRALQRMRLSLLVAALFSLAASVFSWTKQTEYSVAAMAVSGVALAFGIAAYFDSRRIG